MKNKNLILVYSARMYPWEIPMPLINLSAYLIHSSMFLVIYYTAITQFSIFSENSLYSIQKFNPPHNTTPLWNQSFLTQHNRYFTKIPPTPSILEDRVDVMKWPNQLAPKQIKNPQTMTAWLLGSTKTLIKKPIAQTTSHSGS